MRELVTKTNVDTRYFLALRRLSPPASTRVSADMWVAQLDDMIANERAMLALVRAHPGILKVPSTAPSSVSKQFNDRQLQALAYAATLRFALMYAHVAFCN